jgi:putative endonuclease
MPSTDSKSELKRPASASMAADPRRSVGRRGEDHAAGHLERLGYRILARNVRTRFGEIDLIAFDGRSIVFAEVKTRRATPSRRAGAQSVAPLESLRPRQCARLRRLARAWLSDPSVERPKAAEIRFDAIGVLVDAREALVGLEHLEAAW